MLVGRLAQAAVDAIGRTVLQVARSEVRLYVGQGATREVVLVAVLASMVACSHVLVLLLLVVLGLVRVVLEGLA